MALDKMNIEGALQEAIVLLDEHIYDPDLLKRARAWADEMRSEVREHIQKHEQDFEHMEGLRLMAEINETSYERVCVAATLNQMLFKGEDNHHHAMLARSESQRVIGSIIWYDPQMIVYIVPLDHPYEEVAP